jgi:type VI secretion system protein ImpA
MAALPKLEDLLAPIKGSSPGGENLRYDPVYDEIKEARREDAGYIANPDRGPGEAPIYDVPPKVPDWAKVSKLCTGVLTKRSKDLQVAAWLTEALVREGGAAGLRLGLEFLTGLLDRHWEHVYPEIEDGDPEFRAMPLQWVGDYMGGVVKTVPLTAKGYHLFQYEESRAIPTEAQAGDDEGRQRTRQEAQEAGRVLPEVFAAAFAATPKAWYKSLVGELRASREVLAQLNALCDERFGEGAPGFLRLREAIEEVARTADHLLTQKLAADPDPPGTEPVASAGASGAEGAQASAGGAPQTVSAEPASPADAAQRIAAAARFLQRTDPRNPASYLLLRGFRWGELRVRPDGLDPRLLEAPPTEIRSRLKVLLLDGKWEQLLAEAEGVMATPYGRGWLDLQRYVMTACDRLGPPFAPVMSAVLGALVNLVTELPQLTEMTLMDDTPTANAETRAWLAGLMEGRPAPAVPQVSPGGRRTSVVQAVDTLYIRALDEARSGRARQGIELLMREAERERTLRAKFLRRSQAAELMVGAGLEAVALPILRELHGIVEGHKLEEWEAPDIVAQPMALLYRCLRKLEGESEEAAELYRRVCRLDPMLALSASDGVAGVSETPDAPSESEQV